MGGETDDEDRVALYGEHANKDYEYNDFSDQFGGYGFGGAGG